MQQVIICDTHKKNVTTGVNSKENAVAQFTIRKTVTTAIEIQQKTVEGFCGFGRVVGVSL